ncbi:hypothetical protein PAXRUDRAFT_137362 [Paxillus rubicundulus Ve08.2h10]|uniref:Reverse transcriptase Ty1/copia-type domain-containing protein n=1 Tax=Paxillus rubicundulus Ve08.2h10 TaxID=930991 RepID=A0A0D0E0L2_9AGAM|nr:hypothetical protein PAXRUDRAFT_137362 [Paxillus rubicundulus Ve08.2h10]
MCLYIFRKDGQVFFLVVYVDDLLLTASSSQFMNSIKAKLSAAFKMCNLREAKYILRLLKTNWDHKLRTISLSQCQYSWTILDHVGMTTCKPVWTLMAHNSQLSARPGE